MFFNVFLFSYGTYGLPENFNLGALALSQIQYGLFLPNCVLHLICSSGIARRGAKHGVLQGVLPHHASSPSPSVLFTS